jgi:hypothetical protein
VHSELEEAENCYEHEARSLKNKIKAEAKKSSKLSKALM